MGSNESIENSSSKIISNKIKNINISSENNSKISYTKIEAQCYREYMEDASIALLNFDTNSSLFGVFDGHGGNLISNFVSQNFDKILLNNEKYKKGKIEESLIETFIKFDDLLKNPEIDNIIYECDIKSNGDNNSLIQSFQSFSTIDSENNNEFNDIIFSKNYKLKKPKKEIFDHIGFNMGTTANIILLKGNYLYIANAGDCISYMYYNKKAIKLNNEHHINLTEEKNRILKSGNKIINNRINGRLNLTRAIGDLSFKNNNEIPYYEQAVIAVPEVNKIEINNNINFIVMGTDGFWNYINPQKLCEKIDLECKKGKNIEKITKKIFNMIYYKLIKLNPEKTDNITFLIIKLEDLIN